jgi:membrane protein DedA with SNARE-associated domain
MKKAIEYVVLALIIVGVGYGCYWLHGIGGKGLFDWFEANLGYGTIMLLMAIESSFLPLPSEVVIPPAAYFACTGSEMNIYLVVTFGTLGAMIGATVNYVLSLIIGRPIIYQFANSRIGHLCMLNEEKMLNAEKYFDKHGAISTFIGRLIPAVRHLISIPAGLSRMNYGIFMLFTGLGAGIWNCVLAALGYWLSLAVPNENMLFAEIEHYNRYLAWGGYTFGLIIVLLIAYKMWKHRSSKKAAAVVDTNDKEK